MIETILVMFGAVSSLFVAAAVVSAAYPIGSLSELRIEDAPKFRQ